MKLVIPWTRKGSKLVKHDFWTKFVETQGQKRRIKLRWSISNINTIFSRNLWCKKRWSIYNFWRIHVTDSFSLRCCNKLEKNLNGRYCLNKIGVFAGNISTPAWFVTEIKEVSCRLENKYKSSAFSFEVNIRMGLFTTRE